MVKKALLVGINYFGSMYELRGCINDTNHVQDFLVTQCGLLADNMRVLNDGDSMKIPPTRANILQHMGWLVADSKPGDTLVFHYSGHGIQLPDSNRDETDRLDEALCPVDYMTAGYITDDDISRVLAKKVPSGVKLVCFFDCCHSGTACDLRYNFKYRGTTGDVNDFNTWGNQYLMTTESYSIMPGKVYLFSGCYDRDTSADAFVNYESQGAFTFALLQVLKKHGMAISNRLLQKYINCVLITNSFDQRTQFSCSSISDFEDVFVI
jgi:hypothetical protein